MNNIKKKKLITSFIILLFLTLCTFFFSSINSQQTYETKYRFYLNNKSNEFDNYISAFFSYDISLIQFKHLENEQINKKILNLDITPRNNIKQSVHLFKFEIIEDTLNDLREMKISSEQEDIYKIDVIGTSNQKIFEVTFHSENKENKNYYKDLIEKIAYENYENKIQNFKALIENNNKLIKSMPESVDLTFFNNFNDILKENFFYLGEEPILIEHIITIEKIKDQKKIVYKKYISNIEFLSILISIIFALALFYFKKIYLFIFSEK